MGDPVLMQGVDVYCERCGTLQPKPEANTPRSAGVLARRVLDAVGLTESRPPVEDFLRLCLGCRGYSCPTCWNDGEGVCRTCAPLPEPVVEYVAEPEPILELPQPHFATFVPEPIVYPPAPQPFIVAEPEVVVVAAPEPAPIAAPAPAVVVAPEPAPVAKPEPAPEPVIVAPEPPPEPAPQPVTQPAPVLPRMPVLPLPPPRPAHEPMPLPLPTLPAYPVAAQIAFNAQASAAASAAPAVAFEPHMLLAPPPSPATSGSAGLRTCRSCQLSLSAKAHFCRRCGTAQPH